MLLSNFQIIRPPHETTQEQTLEWLISAHTQAEKMKGNTALSSFKKEIAEKFWRIGCKPEHIAKRGHVIEDYLHEDWERMKIYRIDEHPSGKDLSVRSSLYEEYADQIFESYYPEGSGPPSDLIHVSCTGYVSPSGAQKIVSKRNWGHQTTVTHAYHMGCYASIPAIRIAQGFLCSDSENQSVDIVHTELCSLHTNPANHNADQLVSQSLFADGFIKYTVKKEKTKTHLSVLAHTQEIIPNSLKSMTWNVADWGFAMTLQKEVPVIISRALPLFLERLIKKGNRDVKNALFAVHPGGPKILFYVKDLLHLEDAQMAHSFNILKNYGNMSSATLPHIWESILSDPKIPNHTPIVSLAFGPGLSITGAIMEKICGY